MPREQLTPWNTDLMRRDHQWLQARGELLVGSGALHTEDATVYFHTDFGPAGQDKDTNQDYVLVWRDSRADGTTRRGMGIAVADGLTSSFRSEWAAEVACATALRALAEEPDRASSADLFARATGAVARVLRQMVEDMARDPQASCPEGQYLSTWRYILRQGRLLQTTLTLAWIDSHGLQVGMVGDGGLLWRTYAPVRSVVQAQCDLSTQEVNCLGPSVSLPVKLDFDLEMQWDAACLCVLYTDGVGRGVGDNPLQVLDDLDRPELLSAENPAHRWLAEAIRDRPKSFDDNLTLVVIRTGLRER